MSHRDARLLVTDDDSAAGDLADLLDAPVEALSRPDTRRIAGSLIGTLVGFAASGTAPLVTYPEQPGTAAIPAQTTVQLQGRDLGRRAVLLFEQGDPYRPIIVGCLVDESTTSVPSVPGHVDVDADGTSLVVSARERIVLRCGKASITLTRDGKLILQGEYVSHQSSGVLRLKGGSVQIN
jgi:Domain of unknown function (DUF6484)